jgi:hypothetical protein
MSQVEKEVQMEAHDFSDSERRTWLELEQQVCGLAWHDFTKRFDGSDSK